MQRLNSDGLDESQFLPKKWFNPKTQKDEPYPTVNERREAKGDIFINQDGLLQTIIWMPDALEVKGFIDKKNHDTCRSFERILIQAKRTLGVCDVRGVLFDQLPAETKNDMDMFIILHKNLIKSQMAIMIWMVEESSEPGNMRVAVDMIGKILHAIENAQRVIDNAKKAV